MKKLYTPNFGGGGPKSRYISGSDPSELNASLSKKNGRILAKKESQSCFRRSSRYNK